VQVFVERHTVGQAAAFVAATELRALDRTARAAVVARRDAIESIFKTVVHEGVARGVFAVDDVDLAVRAILDMGSSVSSWYRSDGPMTGAEVADRYVDLALSMLACDQVTSASRARLVTGVDQDHGGVAVTDTVLVVGASGLVGAAAVERFLSDGWQVIAASRRAPEVDTDRPFRHLAVDLRDEAACDEAFGDLEEVTHVVYAAVYEKAGLVPGWSDAEQMDTNLTMLRNVMDPLAGSATGLQHVSLLQGTKAYGAHLHPSRSLRGSGTRGILTRTSTGCRRTTSARRQPTRGGRSPSCDRS